MTVEVPNHRAALAQRGLSEWENLAKALATRTDDALADAAALLEPKARTVTLPGALFLAAIAALPTILINQTSANFFFGGTSILIVIGVALDTMKQVEAQMMMRNYEGFLK